MGWLERLRAIWIRLPGPQRIFMLAVAVGLAALVAVVAGWAGRDEYGVLYANLPAEDAGAIVDDLRSSNISYRLRDGGATILVPRSAVYEARLRLATSGLPQGTGGGYEILDSNKMGWTDFVQKLQSRRALEGEIARTIQSLDEVQQARVHLVIPEPSLFQENQRPPTASVVVRLRGGSGLAEAQVQGIVHLVATAVEGLQPQEITVLDTRGRLLSRPTDENDPLGATTDQLRLTQTVEEGLARKAQSALEKVLGPNRAVVRVAADLDFESVETTREIFDPESPVVRSESRTEQSGAEAGTSEESLTNYEISKTVERVVDTPGSIRRVSASVFVDGTYQNGPDGARQYVPRSSEEMTKLTNLIKGALGFDARRGDELTVENIAFDDTDMQRTLEEMNRSHKLELIQKVGSVLVSLLLAAGALLILWRLLKRAAASARQRAPAPVYELPPAPPPQPDPRQLRLERKVQQISQQNPDEVARVIRAWMTEA